MSAGAWWDAWTEAGGLDELQTWLGGVDAQSRVRVRERIAACEYQTILEAGAGLGLDCVQFSNLSHPFRYQGIEPSAAMRAASTKIAEQFGHDEFPIIAGDITDIPFDDASFELVYCRHVLEHLPRFEPALTEMLRVALLEVMVVFFMRPGRETFLYRERDGLWQNRYAKADIDRMLNEHPRVETWFWEMLPEDGESILHCHLTDAVAVDPERVAERMRKRD